MIIDVSEPQNEHVTRRVSRRPLLESKSMQDGISDCVRVVVADLVAAKSPEFGEPAGLQGLRKLSVESLLHEMEVKSTQIMSRNHRKKMMLHMVVEVGLIQHPLFERIRNGRSSDRTHRDFLPVTVIGKVIRLMLGDSTDDVQGD